MKIYWIILVLLSSLLIFTGCSGGGGGGGNSSDYSSIKNLSYIDISNAKSVYIGTNSIIQKVMGKTSSNPIIESKYSLYKINSSISKVKYLDENKNEIDFISDENDSKILTPVFISDLNDDYCVGGYYWFYTDGSLSLDGDKIDPQYLFLIRKNDGNAFRLKKIGLDVNGYDKGDPEYFSPLNKQFFEADGRGNFYYINNGSFLEDEDSNGGYSTHVGDYRRISKISVSGNGRVTSTDITPLTDDIMCFEVDNQGNIVYQTGPRSGSKRKIRTVSGSYMDFAEVAGLINPDFFNIPVWKSTDGCIYYSYMSNIMKFNPGNMIPEPYGAGGLGSGYYRFILNDRTCLVNSSGILEVYNSTATPRFIPFAELEVSNISHACATENYIYVSGKDISSNYFLIKVTPDTGANTKILWNNYEVLSFTASEADGIVFNALRILDGKRVLWKISAGGGPETILRTEEDAEVYYLERIR